MVHESFLGKRLHVSWFIGWISLGVLIGAGLCAVSKYSFAATPYLVIAVSALVVCLLKRPAWLLTVAFASGVLIGLWRGSALKIELLDYRPYYGREVVLQGRIVQDAAYGSKGDQRLNLSDIVIDGLPLAGEVWASVQENDIKRGDIVTLSGTLNEGFGNLSASMYRAEVIEIIHPYPGDVARRVRDWFGNGVRAAIPEPQVNLGLGYLVGQKTALPPELEEQVRIIGLTHVVVASGYNLTILVIFSRKLFARISKYFAALASGVLIMCFMMVTGLSPSMTRAGLVAGLGLLVWYYGRKMHPFVLLSFAACLTVLINPSYVWGDLGWYLSFTSFVGVIVFAPLAHHYFWGRQEPSTTRQLFVETSSAQLLTYPLILLAFGQFSLYALPANILVLPLVPMAMLFTFLAGIVGLAFPPLAELAGLPATLMLGYSIKVIERMANLPNAQNEIEFNPHLMIGSYILLALLIFYLKWRTGHDFRLQANDEKY